VASSASRCVSEGADAVWRQASAGSRGGGRHRGVAAVAVGGQGGRRRKMWTAGAVGCVAVVDGGEAVVGGVECGR